MKYHKTKDGTKIALADLEIGHLKNIIRWIERKSVEGFTTRDGGGTDCEDMWYYEQTFYGEEALIELNYYDYKNELRKRNES